jgi:large subunit ribosomal protein L32e
MSEGKTKNTKSKTRKATTVKKATHKPINKTKHKTENTPVHKHEAVKENVSATKTIKAEENSHKVEDSSHKKEEVQSHKEETHDTKKEIKGKNIKEVKKEIVRKYIAKTKKNKIKKSKEALSIQKDLKGKKKLPVFRGRFGKKCIRRKSIAKWNKWRKPRSIDLDRGLQHGFRPKIGYRNKAEIRGIHPSGYKEVLVNNVNDIEKINVKTEAIRISATVGKRKRNAIVTKANEKEIWILN